MDTKTLVVSLFEIEAVKFGSLTLKSGLTSPVYFDLRVIVSKPKILAALAQSLTTLAKENGLNFKTQMDTTNNLSSGDSIGSCSQLCGVPYTALPIATCMSVNLDVPMIIRRKEAKDYGTKKLLEGKWVDGEACLVVEDVVTSGSSVIETARALRNAGLKVKDAVVILDREQGGSKALKSEGICLHSLFTISQVLKILEHRNLITSNVVASVSQFIAENQTDKIVDAVQLSVTDPTHMSYHSRALESVQPSFASSLFQLMERKKSNLCVAADVTSTKALLQLAASVGPHICILKTHIDILEDFDDQTSSHLRDLAKQHDFLLFEDRKFADIGNTVQAQYGKGIYKMADWADLVNAHPLAGPGVVQGLKAVSNSFSPDQRPRGCLLVAQMSSKGNLISKDYSTAALEMALNNQPFVCGFVSQSRLSRAHPSLVYMTPGVNSGAKGDTLGQTYDTPEVAILEKGSDVIIVGRGITQAADPTQAALEYKEAGWKAYLTRIDQEK